MNVTGETRYYGMVRIFPSGTVTEFHGFTVDADGWMLGNVGKDGWRTDRKIFPSGVSERRVHVEPEPRIGYNTHAE